MSRAFVAGAVLGKAAVVLLLSFVVLNLGGNQVRGTLADQQRVLTINDLFSDVARAAPGFGGMFYDAQGNLNVTSDPLSV